MCEDDYNVLVRESCVDTDMRVHKNQHSPKANDGTGTAMYCILYINTHVDIGSLYTDFSICDEP